MADEIKVAIESDIKAQQKRLATIESDIKAQQKRLATVSVGARVVAINRITGEVTYDQGPVLRTKPTPPLGGRCRKRMHECFNCGAPNRGEQCFYCGELPDPRWYEIEVGIPEPEQRLELVARLVEAGILDSESARGLLGFP